MIKKIIALYKLLNFNKNGNLEIKYYGSKIVFTKEGDLIINAKRHTIHHRDLFFDGCEQQFIEKAIKENSKSKKQLEKYIMSTNRASEFDCQTLINKNIKENVSN
jgi:hypothetical protein